MLEHSSNASTSDSTATPISVQVVRKGPSLNLGDKNNGCPPTSCFDHLDGIDMRLRFTKFMLLGCVEGIVGCSLL